MAEMEQVPERITDLKREVLEAAEMARLAKIPQPGQSAEFMAGPFKGRIVVVEAVHGDEAIVLIEGFKVRSTLTSLEKRS
ncbi:mitochondrial 54S ribosomal protein L40 [uncultured Ruegeria sp.]|uniref:mitochondrial 54S ribosomal protein L40 n=1 Tax=uncultured Ruegeria sp. TaxID=259304 RepID=UPI0026208D75|nr:mitochondrial 54S ribosomal protein L40 [uncultured Ruegeria sp.]